MARFGFVIIVYQNVPRIPSYSVNLPYGHPICGTALERPTIFCDKKISIQPADNCVRHRAVSLYLIPEVVVELYDNAL